MQSGTTGDHEELYTPEELKRALDLVGLPYSEEGLRIFQPAQDPGTWLMPLPLLALLSLVSDRVLGVAKAMLAHDAASWAWFERERERIRTTRKLWSDETG